ncbi:unnamed protein product [Paramecium pentaurelia]|uniref:Uncharacterized protein n=1 Tax=Paramecium pentaurelia TaxID=43138 RepID=A0A8S1WB58_9CILI|nr:unnamed protein product [Paramecium pentaurelia]
MKLFKSAFGKKEQDNNQEKLKQSNGTFTIDEQFMTPEFLYKPSQDGTKKLSKQFFLSLSTIENTFNLQQVKSHSLVEELVAMYQECVQVYDGLMDPIKYYFVDKIKNILNQTDKFQGRNHSASQHVQSISTNNLPRTNLNDQKPFFREFEDFADRGEKLTEFVTPRDEETLYKNTLNKHDEIKKKIDMQQQIIQQQQQELQALKRENNNSNNYYSKSLNQTPVVAQQTNIKQSDNKQQIQSQLENQELSIQARLQLRQKNQKVKKEG